MEYPRKQNTPGLPWKFFEETAHTEACQFLSQCFGRGQGGAFDEVNVLTKFYFLHFSFIFDFGGFLPLLPSLASSYGAAVAQSVLGITPVARATGCPYPGSLYGSQAPSQVRPPVHTSCVF